MNQRAEPGSPGPPRGTLRGGRAPHIHVLPGVRARLPPIPLACRGFPGWRTWNQRLPKGANVILKFFRRKAQPDVQLEQGLEKTRRGVFSEITRLFDRAAIDEALYEDLEMLLIQADVGWDVSQQLVAELRARVQRDRIQDPAAAREILREEMISLLEAAQRNRTVKILQRGVPFVIMVVGVNGVGKTTTIAKLAKYHQAFGRSVMLAAGDTFRAAAIDQLAIWGERLDVPVIAHQQGGDPGAVVFDAMQAAHARNVDVLIVDTAGRLHTKHNLMAELTKLRKIMQKTVPDAPQETILVIDATTGQNGLVQAKEFSNAVAISDIAIAKLDGTAKGGIAFSVAKELGTPISYVGTGEKAADLAEFRPETYVDSLFFGEGEGF
ncbi:MAG: signal recognition particle-docking protein FtsY [Thermomicrobiales bacterium]|nr:signal recognition particle-docking protein FtsY [Thermomicrobiales bacterium]